MDPVGILPDLDPGWFSEWPLGKIIKNEELGGKIDKGEGKTEENTIKNGP